jgi:hypothetical protein
MNTNSFAVAERQLYRLWLDAMAVGSRLEHDRVIDAYQRGWQKGYEYGFDLAWNAEH